MVGYLFVNASQGVGDEIDVTPIFQHSCGFSGFLGTIFQNRPTVDVQPQKEQKTAFLINELHPIC